ncbi:hypothetical protein BJD12_18975 [Xanthomonas vesicatoria ATCC 35937]|nr:hypothetical protein BJD12_18975 [Xanthomonas vesicatoria ATCC 35937]MDG4495365.1 DUF4198 domain-containing protein [Xanthomonas vesicatoria]
MRCYRRTICLLLTALGLCLQGPAMAFFKTLYFFSEVEGVVLLNGRPLAGAEVEREYTWRWGNQRRSSTTRTDQDGRFHFPTVTGRSLTAQLLPHEPVIVQYLKIRHAGRSHQGWFHSKRNYDDKGEFGHSPMRLQCDLADEPAPRVDIGSLGICVRQSER